MALPPSRPPPPSGLFQLYLTRGCLPTASLCLALLNRSLADRFQSENSLHKYSGEARTDNGLIDCAVETKSSFGYRETAVKQWGEDIDKSIGWGESVNGVASWTSNSDFPSYLGFSIGRKDKRTLEDRKPESSKAKRSSFIREAASRVQPSVVYIEARFVPTGERGQGSGFIIDGAQGYVVTNAHVVKAAKSVLIRMTNGRSYNGRVVGSDALTDLAVVQIDKQPHEPHTVSETNSASPRTEKQYEATVSSSSYSGSDCRESRVCTRSNRSIILPEAPLGDSDAVEIGDWVIAMGNPLGLEGSLTFGIISSLYRSPTEVGVKGKRRLGMIQIDAAINPGNSGGPIVNEFGEVIGISTAVREDADGIGFCLPISSAMKVARSIAEGRQAKHPYIGISMNRYPSSKGIRITRIVPSAPADSAGLLPGDHIVSIDGKTMRSSAHVQQMIEGLADGEIINMEIKRPSGLHGRSTDKLMVPYEQAELQRVDNKSFESAIPSNPLPDSTQQAGGCMKTGHSSVSEIDSVLSIRMRVPHVDSMTIQAQEAAYEEKGARAQQPDKNFWSKWWKS